MPLGEFEGRDNNPSIDRRRFSPRLLQRERFVRQGQRDHARRQRPRPEYGDVREHCCLPAARQWVSWRYRAAYGRFTRDEKNAFARKSVLELRRRLARRILLRGAGRAWKRL